MNTVTWVDSPAISARGLVSSNSIRTGTRWVTLTVTEKGYTPALANLLVDGLNKIPGITCLPGDGTFYAFPDVSGLMLAKGFADDLQLSDALLKDKLVALVPGSAFGTPGHMRLSFATSDKVLVESLKRIDEYARG